MRSTQDHSAAGSIPGQIPADMTADTETAQCRLGEQQPVSADRAAESHGPPFPPLCSVARGPVRSVRTHDVLRRAVRRNLEEG